MPRSQIQTFNDIEVAWRRAERESDKRAVWRVLAKGGWLSACREAVRLNERATLEMWLDARDSTKQDIVQFVGLEAAQLVHIHLRCGLVGCRVREGTVRELLHTELEAIAPKASRGFCCDLTLALVGDPLRKAERDLSLDVLLVDTARNEGVGASLLLELISNGQGECYAAPELVFLRDKDARQAEDNACAYVKEIGLWRKEWDVRWQLHRRDGKPLVTLSGPSLGAAFTLGLAKLLV